MKNFIRALPLMLLTGCAGLKPFGGENSAKLELPGTADVSAAATLNRVAEGLRITVEVKDGSLVTYSTKELWESDCVEFYADLRPYRERKLLNQYGPGVFQITIRPPADGVPAGWSFRSTGLPIPKGFTAKAVQTKGGYTVQLFLPAESTREIHGPIRDTIYVDVAVNSVNADGSRMKIFWKGNKDNWQYPHNFAPVTLPRQ
jgi:hypothetical protein